MGDVCEILGLEKPLFYDSKFDSTLPMETPPFPHRQYRQQIDDYQDLLKQKQQHMQSTAKLEIEIESMRQLLQECKQLRLSVLEKKEYSQAFLLRLNKTKMMKEGELLQLNSKTNCSEQDKAKIAQLQKSKYLYDHLFGVKICTKYSNKETITLQIKNKTEMIQTSSKETQKENYIQVENNSPGSAWLLIEKMNKQKVNKIMTHKTNVLLEK